MTQTSSEQTKAEREKRIAQYTDELVKNVEIFTETTWKLAEAILASDTSDLSALVAIARAYYAVFNVCDSAATILGIDKKPFQAGSLHHESKHTIPHAQLPVLASHLVTLIEPGDKLGEPSRKAEQTFETCRILQTYRMTADYMGCERVSHETAKTCIEWAKAIVDKIWSYTRDDWNTRRRPKG